LEGGGHFTKGATIVENRFGKGRTLLLGPDLLFSIMHIQQGIRVLQDGKPAPDGTAAVNEGILKAEDGMVLDWQRDRTPMEPDQGPVFLEPVSDELREIILKSVFHLASEQGVSIPLLWYWPRGLKAVAHMSHDSDGNDPQQAVALLDVMNGCNIKSTWCILYPGGYPRDFYRTLSRQEFEIALHYDALTGGEKTSWSRENFLLQHRWLREEAGIDHITTNKNHYTRWEGRLDLYRWCEEAGIHADQTRGPSKKGTIGFPLGGSQPYFALDDESAKAQFLKTLEINLLAQDLVITCPPEYGAQLMNSAFRHHGIGHFLFHPAHIQKPNVAKVLSDLVDHAHARGMEWWTARQIYEWETLRRGVTGVWDSSGRISLRVARPVPQAIVLLLKPARGVGSLLVNGRETETTPWRAYGFEFAAATMELSGNVDLRWR
jgi:hypothetical protein